MLQSKHNSRSEAPRVVFVTAGAGGMFCGSCLHDNALAGALLARGIDLILVPAYTPIRTDVEDHSIDQVVFGGINLYLRQRIPPLRWLPTSWMRWLDRPGLIRRLVGNRVETDAAKLGDLTMAMLRADAPHVRREMDQFVSWLHEQMQPDLVIYSNLLMAGSAPRLTEQNIPVVVLLQGDDFFINGLPGSVRTQALVELKRIAQSVGAFLVHTDWYAQGMAELLSIPPSRLHKIPVGIAAPERFRREAAAPDRQRPPTVGYLARLTPEKGLHQLCEAFAHLKRHADTRQTCLRIAGWHGPQQRAYIQDARRAMQQAGVLEDVDFVGEVDASQKESFLQSIDILSVPSPYPDPKGLYVLEALAAGVPVVQPDHGAFPELLHSTGGGLLFAPHDIEQLAEQLGRLIRAPDEARRLGRAGQQAVTERHNITQSADATWDVCQRFVRR